MKIKLIIHRKIYNNEMNRELIIPENVELL